MKKIERIIRRIATTTPDQLMSVYSGKRGCACGCIGKHTYRVSAQAAGTKHRGFDVDENECSDAVVARHLKTMQRLATQPGVTVDDGDGTHFAVQTETRLYIAYLLPPGGAR